MWGLTLQNYLKVYNEYPPTRILVQDVAKVMQEATHSGYKASLILPVLIGQRCSSLRRFFTLGWVHRKPATQSKPLCSLSNRSLRFKTMERQGAHGVSGSYFPWRATAIGRNASSAKQFLEKRYNPEMELEDAIHTALLTLKEGFEGEMTADTVEIGIIAYSSHALLLTDSRDRE